MTSADGREKRAMEWLKTALTVGAIFAAIVAAFSFSTGGGLGEDAVVAISGNGTPVPAEEAAGAGRASAAGLAR
jgi:hypothetical protein